MDQDKQRMSPARMVLVVAALGAIGAGGWWLSKDSTPAAAERDSTRASVSAEQHDVEMPAVVGGNIDGDRSRSAVRGETSASSAAPGASPSPTAATSPDPAAPVAGAAPTDVTAAAQAYLDARENQVSWFHKADRDWLAVVEPTMTPEGYSALLDLVGDGSGGAGRAWDESHARGLAVKVFVECQTEDGAVNDASTATVLCAVNDQVIGTDGKPIPVTDVPQVWPYVGPQPSVTLEVRRTDQGWRVQRDYTGLAG